MISAVLVVKDVITDMSASASEELHLSGVHAVSVHVGILNAARNIRQRLIGNAQLSNVPRHQCWALLTTVVLTSSYNYFPCSWKVVITTFFKSS